MSDPIVHEVAACRIACVLRRQPRDDPGSLGGLTDATHWNQLLRLGQESRVSKDMAINPGIDEAWHYNVNPDSERIELTCHHPSQRGEAGSRYSGVQISPCGWHGTDGTDARRPPGADLVIAPRTVPPATVGSKLA
jgi:hypothetical protein